MILWRYGRYGIVAVKICLGHFIIGQNAFTLIELIQIHNFSILQLFLKNCNLAWRIILTICGPFGVHIKITKLIGRRIFLTMVLKIYPLSEPRKMFQQDSRQVLNRIIKRYKMNLLNVWCQDLCNLIDFVVHDDYCSYLVSTILWCVDHSLEYLLIW